jgi:hypothetical protein
MTQHEEKGELSLPNVLADGGFIGKILLPFIEPR